MNRNEAMAYLVKCSDANGKHWHGGTEWVDADTCPTCHGTDDASHLLTPGSRYGYRSGDVAPIAYRHAVWSARQSGWGVSKPDLDHSMSLAVNDHDGVEADLQGYAAELAGADVDAMVTGYLECQLWAQLDMSRDEDGNNPTLDENYSLEDISPEYVDSVRSELAALVAEHPLAVRMYLNSNVWQRGNAYATARATGGQFGHDFYLTRERHGAGFWDRGLGELGDYLTKLAKWAGSASDLDDDGTGVLR